MIRPVVAVNGCSLALGQAVSVAHLIKRESRRRKPMIPESLPSYSGFACGAAGQAYNQIAFRHFLSIERRRAERSGRPLLLILVALRRNQTDPALTTAMAAGIFRGLGETVRE